MTPKRLVIIVIAAAAGLWTYFAVAPFVDNAGERDTSTPTEESRVQDTNEPTTDATSTPKTSEIEVVQTAEEAELAGEDRFPITGTAEHPASGFVRVVQTPGEQIIRFEDYEGMAGPELHVYLAKDRDATSAIDLGPSRANSGNINYGVPIDVDIDSYRYVLIWSEAENELYNYAQIH